MTKIKMFKFYMLTTCVSYTFVILLQTLLFYLNHESMTNDLIVMIFIICIIVNLLINVTHYLELHEWLTNLLSVVEIILVVCASNYLCGYTNSFIQLDNFIGVLVMSIIVYFSVKGIVFIKNNEDAKKINECLKRNRRCN
ncbi:MAG: DUF3021 domain-containing protein [Thomasclavelia sp.]|uniref:DUF3021 domain-containing protein n=1 Tax=Thomasclavelia sp. TaxID=3025757 RepID=UPI00399F0C8F